MKIISEPLEKYFDISNPIYTELAPYLDKCGAWIAGGAAIQAFRNEGFGSTDIDIYFESDQAREYFRYIFRKRIDVDPWTIKCPDAYPAYSYLMDGIKIQIIKDHHLAGIKGMFCTFDFSACCFAIKDDQLWYTEQALEDETNKWLKPNIFDERYNFEGNIKGFRIVKYHLNKNYEIKDEGLQKRFDKIFMNFLKMNPSELMIKEFFELGSHIYEEPPYTHILGNNFIQALQPPREAFFNNVPQPNIPQVPREAFFHHNNDEGRVNFVDWNAMRLRNRDRPPPIPYDNEYHIPYADDINQPQHIRNMVWGVQEAVQQRYEDDIENGRGGAPEELDIREDRLDNERDNNGNF